MERLQRLDSIGLDPDPQAGNPLDYLGLLAQHQLPVSTGWVLGAQVWGQVWHHLMQANPALEAAIATLDRQNFITLQRVSQQAQRSFQVIGLPPDLITDLASWPYSTWLLRASLDTDVRTQELLPPQVGSHPHQTLALALHQFWGQLFTARSLVVWQYHQQSLQRLPLTTRVLPLSPILAAGTLRLRGDRGEIQAVLGLDLPLSRGEAWPARCHFLLPLADTLVWQPGFQEEIYEVGARVAPGVQVSQRPMAELVDPLSADQLQQLIDLGQQAQAVFQHQSPSPYPGCLTGLDLEWWLCPQTTAPGWQFLLTRVRPDYGDQPVSRHGGLATKLVAAPALPGVTTVIQGIGAAAGQVEGIAVVARRSQDLPTPLPPHAIVVLPDLQPDVFLELGAVAGIVTERGGATCHAAILAREIGIPAVVGAPQVTEFLQSGAVVWLDGNRGLVYELPEASAPSSDSSPARQTSPLAPSVRSYSDLQTRVMANVSQIQRLSSLPVDQIAGIGLLRSEWLLLEVLEGRHPWHWIDQGQESELQSRIIEQLEPLLTALGPKPLRYRSLDLRSHEWQALVGSPALEPNPMLGLRGTLSYTLDDRLFQVELAARATLQRAGHSHLQLILPFVRTVEEVISCRRLITQAGLTSYEHFALWIMAEVPSVLFLIPAYAQAGVQGITIGSNDLTQLLLAVDRDQPTIASAYDERHPVVRMAMAHLIREARRCGLVCSICGQAPVRHPDLIADLVNWGISSISVEAPALAFTLETVWQAEQSLKGAGI
ncbi:MAG: putative PEP-binding protein [Nodosilinea sp.]